MESLHGINLPAYFLDMTPDEIVVLSESCRALIMTSKAEEHK